MTLPRLETPHISAYYDETQHIACVTYGNEVTPEVTIAVYRWMASLADYVRQEDVRGGIYDFRRVTKFAPSSAKASASTSKPI